MTKRARIESADTLSDPLEPVTVEIDLTTDGFSVGGHCERWHKVNVPLGNFTAHATLGSVDLSRTEMRWQNLSKRQRRRLQYLLKPALHSAVRSEEHTSELQSLAY